MPIAIGGLGSGVILGSSAAGGILDALTGVATSFAVSVRRLRTAYTGSAMRVRRSSDNAEADIGFTGSGDLDTAALLTHVGAGSGFVSKFYDQSGNGRDLVQATQANQPRIVNAGVIDRMGNATARPAIRTDGVTQYIESGAFSVVAPLTRSIVFQPLTVGIGGANRRFVTCSAATPDVTLYLQSASGNLQSTGVGGNLTVKAAVASIPATVTDYFTGDATSFATYNGVTGATGTKGVGTTISGVSLSAALQPSDALFGDVIVFPSALSTSARQTLEADQKRYYGTP